jgi:hypothetical protein
VKPDAEAAEATARLAAAKSGGLVKRRAQMQVAHVHIDAPEGMRAGAMGALGRDLNRVFRDHSARGRWVITFDRERVSPQNRGKAK